MDSGMNVDRSYLSHTRLFTFHTFACTLFHQPLLPITLESIPRPTNNPSPTMAYTHRVIMNNVWRGMAKDIIFACAIGVAAGEAYWHGFYKRKAEKDVQYYRTHDVKGNRIQTE